jgi:CBS domain-containing protein
MSLKQQILSDPISEIPLRPALTLPRSATVGQAVDLMRGAKLGCVFVVNQKDEPIGKFTERLLIHLLLTHPRALDEKIGDHMAKSWAPIQRVEPIARLIDLMQGLDLRFVCVVDDHGRVNALTGQKGLMEYIAERCPRQVKVSRVGSHPYMIQREGA